MIDLIFTKDCFKIVSLFSVSPGSRFNRKEIKEKILVNNVPLDFALSRLMYSKILKKEGNYYSLNFENFLVKVFIDLCKKQYSEMKELPLKVYFLILDFAEEIVKNKNIGAYLFGSYSKLIYTEKSDVDIAILSSTKINKSYLNKVFLKLEKKYEKNIEVHYFDKSSFYKNKKDPLVKDILKNGIRLV